MEERLDKLLIQRNLVSTRTRAEQIIRESGVKVDGKLINKTGKKFHVDCQIELLEEEIPWVSRGALKLLEAVDAWKPQISEGVFIDIGASTGGFTEVLLSQNARKVYCVDVGKDQLHERIKSDPRVSNLEKTHVREITTRLIPEPADGCVIDVSFISLTKIFPFIHSFLKTESWVIALIKPQFEVGKENVGKGGIVKNHNLYKQVIDEIKTSGIQNNLHMKEFIESPILGGDGNKEFLAFFEKKTL